MGARPRFAFERGVLCALAPAVEAISPAGTGTPAAFAEAGRESIAALAGAMGLDGPALVHRRFEGGRRCFVARVDGEIAAYCWVSQSDEYVGELERAFRIAADEAYIWNCATLPRYRKRGLYNGLLRAIVAALQAEGVRLIWIGSSLGNRASIRGMLRAGFRPVVRIAYARLFNLRCQWVSRDPAAPGPLVAAARRVLGVSEERAFGPVVIGLSPLGRSPEKVP